MANRTRSGSLQLTDPDNPDQSLIVIPNSRGIVLYTVDRGTDTRTAVHLGRDELRELLAELGRIGEDIGI